MQKVIDLGLEVPSTIDETIKKIRSIFFDEEGRGLANYRRIFGPRWAAVMGTSLEEIDARRREMSEAEFSAMLAAVAGTLTVTPEDFIAEMDKAGIEWCLINGDTIEDTAKFIQQFPDRARGIANINPFGGMQAVRTLEQAVKEMGISAYYASPFDWKIRADNALYFPLYAKAAELDIPVFIYTAMNYNTELPMDLARPLYLDPVAMAFPKLRIVADCGGWPWVPELVGVARRHQNVYINTSSHRPKHLATPGSGWEMLLQFGNTLLQDQIVFASGADDLGLPVSMLVEEMKALPLKDHVREKWLYGNARRVFQLN
jgi:predicted TIM-barrel fold metal-dependent hydrolase